MEERIGKILSRVFLERPRESSKADFGRVLVIGGSEEYPNAPVIAAKAALRSGVGYVAFAGLSDVHHNPVPDSVIEEPGLRREALEDGTFGKKIGRYGAIVFGNGIADNSENAALLKALLADYEGDLVIDATGLDVLRHIGLEALKAKERLPEIVLTPHLGEYARLFGLPYRKVPVDSLAGEAFDLATEYAVTICLKGASVVAAEPYSGFSIIPGENPSLARAGTGDALAGLIGGFLATKQLSQKEACEAAYGALLQTAEYLDRRILGGTYGIDEIISAMPRALFEALPVQGAKENG